MQHYYYSNTILYAVLNFGNIPFCFRFSPKQKHLQNKFSTLPSYSFLPFSFSIRKYYSIRILNTLSLVMHCHWLLEVYSVYFFVYSKTQLLNNAQLVAKNKQQ